MRGLHQNHNWDMFRVAIYNTNREKINIKLNIICCVEVPHETAWEKFDQETGSVYRNTKILYRRTRRFLTALG